MNEFLFENNMLKDYVEMDVVTIFKAMLANNKAELDKNLFILTQTEAMIIETDDLEESQRLSEYHNSLLEKIEELKQSIASNEEDLLNLTKRKLVGLA